MNGSAKSFSSRKALVIGGSGGIGRAVSLALAQEGAAVTVHGGSSKEKLEGTLAELKAAGGTADGFLLEIKGPEDAEKILSETPDILVCAWGPFARAALENTNAGVWEKMALQNLAFPGALVSLALPGMIERGFGRILLFGGTNTDTIRGFSTTAAYSAAKTALGVLAKSAARAGSGKNVACNVLCPGLTGTEFLDEKAKAYNRERSPGGKPLEPGDVARFAMAILKNPGLNGAVIPFDGGLVL